MSNALAPSVTAHDSRGRKFVSIVEAAYNKAGLSEREAQRVNETSGLADLVSSFIADNRLTDRFKNEEVRSSYTYPKEYKGPKPLGEQINTIGQIFGLDPACAMKFAKHLPTLPDGAEGWFAVPSVSALAVRFFLRLTGPAEQHCGAVELVHEKIKASRLFRNGREGQIRPGQLRVAARTLELMGVVAEQQKGDILIIAAQLGMRQRGRSVRRTREVFASNEYGLTSHAVGSIILVHPTRLVQLGELNVDCSGDEFSGDGSSFARAPYFNFDGDGVRFGAGDIGFAHGSYGSASAFLPQ